MPTSARWRLLTGSALGPLLTIVATSCGCARVEPSCAALGLCDPPVPAPEVVDVLCDGSRGSSCTQKTLAATIDVALRHVRERPGSRVRVWGQGARAEDTAVFGEVTISEAPKSSGSERARRSRLASQVASVRELLLTSAERYFALKRPRRSPVAESIARVLIADAGSARRHIIVVTDGREVSNLGDLECARLPTEERFLAVLKTSAALGPASLTGIGVSIVFAAASNEPGSGCRASVAREIRVRGLWESVLRESGAEPVEVVAGPPTLQHAGEEPEEEER